MKILVLLLHVTLYYIICQKFHHTIMRLVRNIYWSLCLNKANAYHFDHGSVFGWFYRPVAVNKFQFFFSALRFSFDRCTIIINFCYLLLLQKCARLFVFCFDVIIHEPSHSVFFIFLFFYFPPMNPSSHQSFWLCGAYPHFTFSPLWPLFYINSSYAPQSILTLHKTIFFIQFYLVYFMLLL